MRSRLYVVFEQINAELEEKATADAYRREPDAASESFDPGVWEAAPKRPGGRRK